MGNTDQERPGEEDRYFSMEELSRYSGLSLSTIKRGIRSRTNTLPHHTVHIGDNDRGRLLIYKREFDAWVRRGGRSREPEPAESTAPGDVDVSWIQRGLDK